MICDRCKREIEDRDFHNIGDEVPFERVCLECLSEEQYEEEDDS